MQPSTEPTGPLTTYAIIAVVLFVVLVIFGQVARAIFSFVS